MPEGSGGLFLHKTKHGTALLHLGSGGATRKEGKEQEESEPAGNDLGAGAGASPPPRAGGKGGGKGKGKGRKRDGGGGGPMELLLPPTGTRPAPLGRSRFGWFLIVRAATSLTNTHKP